MYRTRRTAVSAGRGLSAIALALALVASGCGDSEEVADPDATTTTAASGEMPGGDADCSPVEWDDVADGGEFVDYAQLVSAGDNTSFDPAAVQTLDESQITNSLFDGLTDFDYSNGCEPELKGLAAESWEVNDDSTEFVFTIKEGLEFSNGEPVLPHNFKQAWERLGSKELGAAYSYLISFIKDGSKLNEGELDTLDSIVADDEAMTLTVTLEAPLSDFPAIVSFAPLSPITDEDLARVGNTTGWGKNGVYIGNGPFVLDSAEASDQGEVVMTPNESWAGDVTGYKDVVLDKVTFKIISDVESAFQAFDSGEGDASTIPSGKYKSAMAKYPNTVGETMLGTYYFDIGHEDPVLGGEKNLKLRQALALAVDRSEINDKAYEGVRQISTGVTPPGIPGFEMGLGEFATTDVDRAKKLYQEWQDEGNELSGDITISFNAGGSHQTVVEVMQANIKDVLGIDVKLNPIDEDYFKVIAEEGGCQICRAGWYADYPTYGNFMVDLFSRASIGLNNFGRFSDDEFEELIADALKESDEDKRGELYRSAEKRLLNDTAYVIALNWYTGDQVFRDTVGNYKPNPLGAVPWERVGFKK